MPKIIKFTNEQINEIIELYNNKLNLWKIGTYFSVSKNTIKKILKENNIKIRTCGETQKGKPSKLKGKPKSEIHKQHLRKPKKTLSDGTYYPFIPSICECNDLNCREIVYKNHKFISGHQFKGIPKSESHKKKIGLCNKNRKQTEEQKYRSSKAIKKYYRLHPEAKEKISKRQTGRTLSEEHKKHIKESAARGEYHSRPWLGKRLSQEHIENIKKSSPHLSGDKHPNWQGGITILKTQIWHSEKYNEWRTQIFIRDNRTCQSCGSIENIEAHHIKEISKIIKDNKIITLDQAILCDELWDINNGKTLCKKCHSMTNSYRKRINKFCITTDASDVVPLSKSNKL